MVAYLHDFIHSFRMQGFFLLAGFFSGMSLLKDSPQEFLRKRVCRLGIPLLFCGLIVNHFLNCANHQRWSDFLTAINTGVLGFGEMAPASLVSCDFTPIRFCFFPRALPMAPPSAICKAAQSESSHLLYVGRAWFFYLDSCRLCFPRLKVGGYLVFHRTDCIFVLFHIFRGRLLPPPPSEPAT